MDETNDWNVKIEDAIKLNAENGDTLLVTLPPQSVVLPTKVLDDMFIRVAKAFEESFSDKDVRVLVVPHGMEVQLIKSSELKDK